MHGAGNDFVVIDQRMSGLAMSPALARALGDRHKGVGFDQLALISEAQEADVELVFYNSDGSTAGACGNATRCIAAREMAQSGSDRMTLRTERGILVAERDREGLVRVNMGQPLLDWKDIPLSQDIDTLKLPIEGGPSATGMGNPHMSFFVDNADQVDLAEEGAKFELHPLYPERTNVQFAHVLGPDHLRMRVWERGVGITLASGSSACAVAVAAHRRGLTGRQVLLDLDGGQLQIEWAEDGVWMAGPTAHVFSGTLTPEFLDGLR